MQQGPATWLAGVFAAALVAGGLALWLRSRPAGSGAAPAPASAGPASAPSPGPAPLALPEAAGAWRAEGPASTWDRESIFSYIDGHAEVYLAYGMRRCISRRYSGPAGEGAITLDAFELASPYDAFGVFTHDRDGEAAGVGRESLFRYGWLSFWKGRWFVSVVAEKESDASRTTVLALGQAVAGLLADDGGPLPPVVSALPANGLDSRSVRYLHDPQILATHRYVDAENVFGLGPSTPAALGRYERAGAKADLLLVDYPEASAAARAQSAFEQRVPPADAGGGKDGVNAARAAGTRLAAVLGAGNEALARALLEEALRGDAATPAAAKGGRP